MFLKVGLLGGGKLERRIGGERRRTYHCVGACCVKECAYIFYMEVKGNWVSRIREKVVLVDE